MNVKIETLLLCSVTADRSWVQETKHREVCAAVLCVLYSVQLDVFQSVGGFLLNSFRPSVRGGVVITQLL